MRNGLLPVAALVLTSVLTAPWTAYAEKLPDEFREAFEERCRDRQTYGVVVRDGVPTTSIYGVKGDETQAYYSIDVIGGEWKVSEGIFDFNQTAVDTLRKGEILELVDLTYKDNRVDLRFVSQEAHKVTRGNWLLKDRKPEPVSTNFKFFLPVPKSRTLTAADADMALDYVEAYVRLFPDEASARSFSARLSAGETPKSAKATGTTERAAPPTAKTSKREIKAGMTPLQVIEILGKPKEETSFETMSKWTYPDLTVIFQNGRVKEVRF